MINWRRETNGDWFGDGPRYRYAAQRNHSTTDCWELWRQDRFSPLPTWERVAQYTQPDGMLIARWRAEQLDSTGGIL